MMIVDTLECGWTSSTFLVFSANVFGPLVYYSHMFSLVTAFGLGLFVILKNHRSSLAKLFFGITTIFSLWVFSDIVLWADENPHHIMFFWSLTILLEPIIYILSLYFLFMYSNEGRPVSKKIKAIILLLVAPTLIFTPTRLGILGFNYTNCDREVVEGLLVYYGYIIELIIALWAVIHTIRTYKIISPERRRPFIFVATGTILFMFAFAWGNLVGTISEDWTLGQYGLFGMPVFLAFITYAMVKFKAFNVKLIGTQALIAVIWISLGAVLFVREIEQVRIIVPLTLILLLILGILLVRSVKREIEQRERIEKLAGDLERANSKLKELDQLKSEFLSLATHQIRAPLTAIKGYSSMLIEGDFGVLPQKASDSVGTIMKSCQNLINIVEDFLNISRIEQGRMVYYKTVFDMRDLAKETLREIKPNIDKAGLSLEINMPPGEARVNADRSKVKQIIGNIVDNAIKYTPQGGIHVYLNVSGGKVKTEVKDSGVGINPSEIDKLFNKFSRTKDANKTNVSGTGLGLYIAKKMAEAQGGDILVSSPGLGHGTTFTVELPVYKK